MSFLLHIMESNCLYTNFQQAKPPLICSQGRGAWPSSSCISALFVQSLILCHISWTCLYETWIMKKLLLTSSHQRCQLFDKPKHVADEWLLLNMWGWQAPFLEHILQDFFPSSTKDNCDFLQYQSQTTMGFAFKAKTRTLKTDKI